MPVSSPAATGGAGTFFEQHVDAYWLAQLLVRATPPVLLDCAVVELHLQTERLGWNTDDFLIIGERAETTRKLAGQVKRSFTVSAADDNCRKAIQDFWKDYRSPERFSPNTDRFALVTQRGGNTLLEHFVGLLDCARASRDGAEFQQRLGTDGFIAARAVTYCDEIRKVVGAHEGRDVTEAEIWPFLRLLHVISLDLQTSTAQHEALIKTLLVHTAADSDARSIADASWNELLAIAAQGMAEARSFRWIDLPQLLRQRHSVFGGTEQRTLRALADHTTPVLRGIRSTIGRDFHLRRAALVQNVIERLESTQVVLLSAPAGSGKSAIAKDALALISGACFTFGFRAEELAQPHFDATLESAKIPANRVGLQAVLASQDRKVVLVESVERLLERSTREAFGDLLDLAAADRTIRILLTCRDYSTDLVRDCFLVSAGVGHFVIDVPQLSDAELSEVEAAYPELTRPLASDTLRRIMRNPYFLDKALQISWAPERPLPESEREFRRLFWQQIIRADQNMGGGMPQRREEAFEQIALRRARALTVYVLSADLDAGVIDSLRRDSLIASLETSPTLVAPAHDVLEDWAILHWIEKEHVAHGGSFGDLSASIGLHPAVRRAYRTWVAELLDRDAGAADQLFQATVIDASVPAQFRDDTLVSLLRAPTSAAFLERNSARLLANGQELFRRVIHLLRVACVTAPAWLPASKSHGSLFNVPKGPAWGAVLRLVETHREAFAPKDGLLLLGLIEDWGRSVAYWLPYPEGAEGAAAIAHWLLPGYAAYRDDSPGKRIMKVIAKIPLSAGSEFEALIRGTSADRRDRTSGEFREVIFAGMNGTAAGRDVPEVVIEAAVDYLLCNEDDLREDGYYGGSLDLELTFGIKEGLRHDYFPASALRGPWIQLLRSHPDEGITFFIKTFNHSADWYAHPRVHERVEPPVETELTFADGATRKQWINWRLWCWYRGTSVGPYVLQSLLMAFERWLLEYAKTYPDKVDAILVNILRRSDNAALTAVVASVATAFPLASGEALLVLLSSPLCIGIDRQRMAAESSSTAALLGMFPTRAEDQIYEEERKEADALPHRRYDLEQAIANLQFGFLAPRVHEVLDRHRAVLPPVDQQNEEHRTWRLAMHRMDLRQYTVSEVEVHAEAPTPADAASAAPRRLIRLDPSGLEPDVKEMVSTSAVRFDAINARLGLLMWAYKIFKHEEDDTDDPAAWQQRLSAAQVPGADGDIPDLGDTDIARGGPGIVAAVSIRDHWEEMSDDERTWCVERLCSEVIMHADEWNDYAPMQRYDMAADRACAWVLPLLLGKRLTGPQRERVQSAFATGLTHAINEVQWYIASGIAEHLWAIDGVLAMRCINALAMQAGIIEIQRRVEDKKPYNKRRKMEAILAEAASAVRNLFWKQGGIPSNANETLDVTEWFGAEANGRILTILSKVPDDPAAVAGFVRAAQTLVAWWDSDDDRRQGQRRRERNHDSEMALSQHLQSFLLRTSTTSVQAILEPLLGAIESHTRETHWIIRGLTFAEDGQTNTRQYWFLWGLFADRVRAAKWLPDLKNDHPRGDEVISAIFLGSSWKENVRHWKSLEGYAHHVHQLFEDLPATAAVLDRYVRFLYHIGEHSLPAAFVLIVKRLRVGDSQEMLKESDTIFLLEVLLLRHVYGKPLELKRDAVLRDAVLALLDILVEHGSSAAFRMRDDFVTPVATS